MGIDKHRMTIEGKEYRLQRIISETEEDLHHIIGKCLRHEGYDINNPLNKEKIKRRQHTHLNNFFGQNQAPHLQLRQCLELWEPVLSDVVREELYAILSLPRGAFYKEELVKKKRKDKELFSDEIGHFYKKEI